ncbi:flavodoxin [Lacrimispora brassicae]
MSKSIVIYFTWSGRTGEMAKTIAALTGAAIQEVLPEMPYAQNYNAVVDQGKKEISAGFHPPIKKLDLDLSQYDIIFIGTPIWWGTMAPPITTFLNENDLGGKTVAPFTSHGGGGKGHSDRDFAKLCSGAKILDMYTAYEGGGRSTEKEISAWIKKNGL